MGRAFGSLYAKALARPIVHKGELLSVQRMRGIAVLMVIIVHIEDVARHLQGWSDVFTLYSRHLGYSAADMFFVISGFIMAYITLTRPFEARGWAISRFIRIYPMYILFSSLVMLLWLYDSRMTMGTGEQTWSRVLLSLSGLPQADLPLLFVGWTVEHEIVFYTVVFLTARFLGRENLYLVMATLSALAVARWLYQQAVGVEIWDYHLASPYLIQFTMGVFVFKWRDRLFALAAWKVAMFGIAAFASALLVAHSGHINQEPISRVVLFGVAYSCLLVLLLNRERAQLALGFFPKHRDALVWMGDISYSIYLTHPFVLAVFGRIFRLVGSDPIVQWGAVCAAALVTILVGVLTHVLIERQVMEIGRRLSRAGRAMSDSKGAA